jgi:putative pyruvate formate lyase activating enzyme
MATFEPGYIQLLNDSRLKSRSEQALARLAACDLCPRNCGVNRIEGETGYCGTADKAVISGYHAHFGEERPLVGRNGSGTIFFSHCNLLCNFCQNYDISHLGEGHEVTAEQLAACMIQLQDMGCHNINFVSPSHVVPQIISALLVAARSGLHLPLIYNTGGYDNVETLRLLDGIMDIYMPDFKFMDPATSRRTCNAPDYGKAAQHAITEMHRQVGDLVIGRDGIAQRGLLIRHLVLPHSLADTRAVMTFIANRISTNTYVNIMSQYRPCGTADEIPELSRTITRKEFEEAIGIALDLGIGRLD